MLARPVHYWLIFDIYALPNKTIITWWGPVDSGPLCWPLGLGRHFLFSRSMKMLLKLATRYWNFLIPVLPEAGFKIFFPLFQCVFLCGLCATTEHVDAFSDTMISISLWLLVWRISLCLWPRSYRGCQSREARVDDKYLWYIYDMFMIHFPIFARRGRH